jgi:DDE superfamily endonuclease
MPPPFGGFVSAIATAICKPLYTMPRAPVGRVFFSRGQRRKIERLSRCEPESVGRHATHWSFRSLAEATVEQGYADAIDYTTVRAILYAAKLRRPLFRFWKTTVWDDEAVARTLKILWYYERIESLWQRGEVLLATDEKPNLQVLERVYPKQPMRAGQIERVEFDYERHGTIHLLVGLTLDTGHMYAECLDKNDGEHFRPAVPRFFHPYSWAHRIHLIIDNGSSPTSEATTQFFERLKPRVQVLFTPTHASWLNQAEALLQAFSTRYLIRGSWCSRTRMVEHIIGSKQEYNQRYAHPFDWQWSCRDFRYWLNNTPGLIRCKT